MSSNKRLSALFETATRINIDDSSKIIIIGDCHRGDGSHADDFLRNEDIYLTALNHYFKKGFTYIELGDGDELWENKKFQTIIGKHLDAFQSLRRFYLEKRLYFIFGNHDIVKRSAKFVKAELSQYYDKQSEETIPLFEDVKVHESLVLVYQKKDHEIYKNEIMLVHGHQVDNLNSCFWRLSRFLVRYLWRPLELIGISVPTSPSRNPKKMEMIGEKLSEWAISEDKMLIAGHNHRPMFAELGGPLYFNAGSCVQPFFITGIEIDQGKIELVRWGIKAKDDRKIYIVKDIIGGPEKLSDFLAIDFFGY